MIHTIVYFTVGYRLDDPGDTPWTEPIVLSDLSLCTVS